MLTTIVQFEETMGPLGYLAMFYAFQLAFVLVGMLDSGNHASPAYTFAAVTGTAAAIIQGIGLVATTVGFPITTVAHGACIVLTSIAWTWFAAFGQANVLSGSSIGVYNWVFVCTCGVFTAMAVVRSFMVAAQPNVARSLHKRYLVEN